jgi:hypothetical protein
VAIVLSLQCRLLFLWLAVGQGSNEAGWTVGAWLLRTGQRDLLFWPEPPYLFYFLCESSCDSKIQVRLRDLRLRDLRLRDLLLINNKVAGLLYVLSDFLGIESLPGLPPSRRAPNSSNQIKYGNYLNWFEAFFSWQLIRVHCTTYSF